LLKKTVALLVIASFLCLLTALGCKATSPLSISSSTLSPSTTPITKTTSVPPPPPPPPQSTATLPAGQEPIEIVSWTFPPGHINPAGPYMELTIKNIWSEPVIYLTMTLQGERIIDNPTFADNKVVINFYKGLPLLPGKIYTQGYILIGPDAPKLNNPNSATINGTLQSLAAFTYTKQVQITPPAQ
jgi:hypothetical protein